MKKANQYLTAMCDAHVQGDVNTVRKLLEAHPELENMGPDNNHTHWLHWAAQHGQIGVVEFWLDRGCDVNVDSPGGSKEDGLFTALHIAKDADMTRYLLSRGALVNACHRVLGTPLHYAIIRATEPSQRGRRRPEGANLEQIRALIDAGADLTLMNGEDKGYTPLTWAMNLRRKSAEKLLREIGAPEKGLRPFGSRSKLKTLNLQKDFNTVYDYLAQCICDFDPATYTGLGGPGKVKMILLGFDFVHFGWVVVVLDTRPDAELDGEWTAETERKLLKMKHWKQAEETISEGPITLVQIDGSQSLLAANSNLAGTLGEMLKSVLLKSRASGLFATLATAEGCEICVEHFDGEYAWQETEVQGTEN